MAHVNGNGALHASPDPGMSATALEAVKWRKWNDLTMSHGKFYCLKAILDLRIPDILDEAGGQLTLAEIAAKLPSKTVNKWFLSRVLTFAALCGFFDLPQKESESEKDDLEMDERVFALNPVSMLLVEKRAPTPDMAMSTFLRFQTSKVAVEPFEKLAEAVLTGSDPFTLVNGKNVFEVCRENPAVAQSFHNAMLAATGAIMLVVLREYDGFKGSKVLVDVGGGFGASVRDIGLKYPDIQCINFDLPDVIARAPEIPGVKHVGGNMFEGVPEGDTIFMKWILHDWSDDDCVRILQNCLKALSDGGRVLLVENVLPPPAKGSSEDYVFDMVMLAHTPGGRERTENQWRKILSKAGFQSVKLTPAAHLFVIEAYKS